MSKILSVCKKELFGYFSSPLAMIFLGERPDKITLLGATIIVVAGYYTIWRERKLALK